MITQHVTFNTCDHVRVTINSHDDDTRAQWILRVREFLLERLRLDRTTTYTEVNTVVANRLGVALLDFSNPADRDEMSRILREVVILDQRERLPKTLGSNPLRNHRLSLMPVREHSLSSLTGSVVVMQSS